MNRNVFGHGLTNGKYLKQQNQNTHVEYLILLRHRRFLLPQNQSNYIL